MKTVLITGKGRSGTTWLAQILNTYVHCCYKHEPFLPSKPTRWLDLRHELDSQDITALRRRYAAIARAAVHGVDMPPFPPKSVRPQDARVLRALYALGTRVKPLRVMFEAYARPHMHEDADVLIKDVNFPNEQLPRLCEVLEPYLVPIVRNPFANIASHLQGVRQGYFGPAGAADKERVRELAEASDDPSIRAYLGRLDELSALQFETVRWRLQVEPLIAFAQDRWPRSRLVVYEDLCEQPVELTESLFEFLGWRLGDTTRKFLSESTAGARDQRDAEHAYYAVYRDPKTSMNKWREQLDSSEQQQIASIFGDSPFRRLWRNLPV